MAETYTSGAWTVKPGSEDSFVAEWTSFATWASDMDGSGTFRLVRDLNEPNRYTSFASWASFEEQQTWKSGPEFKDRIGRVRSHCEDFTPTTHELVVQVN